MSQPPPIPQQPQPPFATRLDYQGPRNCPGCGIGPLSVPGYTWWGGVIGHRILGIERCQTCKKWWVKKTGAPGTTRIAIYAAVSVAIVLLVLFLVGD